MVENGRYCPQDRKSMMSEGKRRSAKRFKKALADAEKEIEKCPGCGIYHTGEIISFDPKGLRGVDFAFGCLWPGCENVDYLFYGKPDINDKICDMMEEDEKYYVYVDNLVHKAFGISTHDESDE
ncbi:MAG: hypothetical protein RPU59_04135 [Candidatus Sedimenticola sp. (ex Thyasira tokunagai)]